jgi:lipid A ethanolaminephosphotransferase
LKRSAPLSRQTLIAVVSLFLVLFYNFRFYEAFFRVYPPQGVNLLYLGSTVAILWALTNLILTLLTPGRLLKPVLTLVLFISAIVAYFMQTYHIVIDHSMIRNVIQTDTAEASDLFTFQLLLYVLFLGILPSVWIWVTPIRPRSLRAQLLSQLKSITFSFVLIVALILAFSRFYTSFFREHKPLRYHTNPIYWIYSTGYYLYDRFFKPVYTFQRIGEDATIDEKRHRTIVFFVVGEAARADHFSLNGYMRDTTPKLLQEDIINYPKMYSCGTSTAHSVPCMFSPLTRTQFKYEKARYTENALDVLKHTGRVSVLWRDNNSDSKGVAARVTYQNYRTSPPNTVCDEECRDIGMLKGLDRYIAEHNDSHIMIVLHQMGNHGPAYYKRYPKSFEIYEPVCKSNRLETCSRESIINAYDNALRYTDTFLAHLITLAKRYEDADVAVFYVADHGESLGENGIYLHGLPYFIAPDAQKHVGAFLWLNKNFKRELDMTKVRTNAGKKVSHDNIFHTLLGLFGVKTDAYDPALDLTH